MVDRYGADASYEEHVLKCEVAGEEPFPRSVFLGYQRLLGMLRRPSPGLIPAEVVDDFRARKNPPGTALGSEK